MTKSQKNVRRVGVILGAVVIAVSPCAAPSYSQKPRASPAPPAQLPDSVRLQVVSLTNSRRAKYGLPPLVPDAVLMQTAQAHAEDMNRNGYFDHADRQGKQVWDRTRAAGYPRAAIAENIAMGQRDADQVMTSWMQSDGHRANILNSDYRAVGVGVVGLHWVQVFGSVVVRDANAEASRNAKPLLIVPPSPLLPPIILADFEKIEYDGWDLTGNCWGRGPENAAFAGTVIRGWAGLRFATSAHGRPNGGDASSGTGRALSAPFTLPADAATLRFKIAGGRYPSRCCLNLIVDGKTVRTGTGSSPYVLQNAEWNVADLRGKTARLEILDTIATGSHAYLHIDDISLVRQPPPPPPPAPRRRAKP